MGLPSVSKGSTNRQEFNTMDAAEEAFSLARFLRKFRLMRPHSALNGKTIHAVYTEGQTYSSRPE